MSKDKVPGNMITEDETLLYCRDYHLGMGGNDWLKIQDMGEDVWLKIQDMGEDVWLTLKNECAPSNPDYKEYYHTEISKKSKLWLTLVGIIKECHEFEGK